ncbi:MAG: BolA/IbaG family iron-sulfur metabolism protein [Candidatus Neomarinimicrobiota bacterium]|nr:BolA/IbaG family iron-sulfur metabolism protein [Candidatus Neomarinimicrobiota bacterium]
METNTIAELIKSGLNNAQVEVKDTTGGGDHFSAIVVSDDFQGLSLVDQHQLVYKSLEKYLTKEIHALQLKTLTMSEWNKNNSEE